MSKPRFIEKLEKLKSYHRNACNRPLVDGQPVVIVAKVHAFSTFVNGLGRPVGGIFGEVFELTAAKVCCQIHWCRLAYVTADELVFVVWSHAGGRALEYFGGKVHFIVSMISSVATMTFNKHLVKQLPKLSSRLGEHYATFKTMAFSVVAEDVDDYLAWRQYENAQQSLRLLAAWKFTPKRLMFLNKHDLRLELVAKGIDWDTEDVHVRRGTLLVNAKYGELDGESTWVTLDETPNFENSPNLVSGLLTNGRSDLN